MRVLCWGVMGCLAGAGVKAKIGCVLLMRLILSHMDGMLEELLVLLVVCLSRRRGYSVLFDGDGSCSWMRRRLMRGIGMRHVREP